MDYFNAFKSLYPRKAAWVAAQKAANKIKSEEWLEIMPALQKHITYWKQQGTSKNYIPLPASWLNGRRWEDELELEAEVQVQSACHTFISLVNNKNHQTMPIMPNDIKRAVFRMGIPWGKLQQMERLELEAKFEHAYNNMPPLTEIDQKSKAAGD